MRHAPTTPPAGPESTVRTGSRAARRAGNNAAGGLHYIHATASAAAPRRAAPRPTDTQPTRGARYAFTTVVDARSYSRNSGRIRCDAETGIPSCSSAASTRFSVPGLANEKSSDMATASAPLARTASTSASSSSSLGSRSASPSALTRSATPKRSSRGTRHTGIGANQS